MELTQLGPYRIEREIGRGGMGTVYTAIEETTGEKVAVKVLAPLLANQEGFRDRFAAEIEALQELDHPNIVKLFASGQQSGCLYYAMEFVDGCSLEDELFRRRRFQWQEVCRIGIDLCRALKLAHDHGVIHRDIKPANLLWSKDEQIKLSDFGIARLFGNTGFTSEGGVLGTAEYMAPEQAEGNRITHHCDLYSLGGVFYAMLAGRPPFQSKSMLKLLQMQRFSQPESVCKYAPDTPSEFDQIILQLLEKEPNQRFPNALLVARRLEAMQRALSLKSENEQAGSTAQVTSGFEIHPYDADRPDDEIGETMDIESVKPKANELIGGGDAARAQGGESGDNSLQTTDDHFTTTEEALQKRELSERPRHPFISAPTWLLAAALLATMALGWYFLQPASPNSLYERIQIAAQNDRLVDVKQEVDQFLRYYPRDPRWQTVSQYQSAIEAIQLRGRALLQARMLNKRYRDSPIGPEYLSAIESAAFDPETAANHLRALISLYKPLSDEKLIGPFVQAAEIQLPFLDQQASRRIHVETQLIERRLETAQRMMKDDPAQTKSICQAIFFLYKDKTWADSLVKKATQLLEESNNSGAKDIISSRQ